MRVYIIDNGSKYIDALEGLLSDIQCERVAYGDIKQSDIASDDLVILSGGHNFPVLWHDKEYQKELNLIQSHRGPLIGICLGFQLIAHYYGSHLCLLERRRKGKLHIFPTHGSTLLDREKSIRVYESHNWSAKVLKKPLIALAQSEDGIEIFRHQDLPVYGFQFHPESSKDTDGEEIFMKIVSGLHG